LVGRNVRDELLHCDIGQHHVKALPARGPVGRDRSHPSERYDLDGVRGLLLRVHARMV